MLFPEKSEWDPEVVEKIVERQVRKAEKKYLGCYLNAEDFRQIAWIAVWQADLNWRPGEARFERYVKKCIVNEIRRAALQSMSVLSAPYRQKERARTLRSMLDRGFSRSEIKKRLSISDEEYADLFDLTSRLDSFPRALESQPVRETPYSTVDDALSIPDLTHEEQQIIRSATEDTAGELGIPESSLRRKLEIIREKLARHGYATGD